MRGHICAFPQDARQGKPLTRTCVIFLRRRDGKTGFPVVPYVSMEEETLDMKRIAHDHTCFNLKRSDSLPLDRDLKDNRHHKCGSIRYPDNLPTSSIVFVFFNEPLSPLYRSIISVRTALLLLGCGGSFVSLPFVAAVVRQQGLCLLCCLLLLLLDCRLFPNSAPGQAVGGRVTPPTFSLHTLSLLILFCFTLVLMHTPAAHGGGDTAQVLDRTPPEILHEIILVDDGSDAAWLKQPLEDFIELLPKTKLVRMPQRLGLMAARVTGAEAATGDTVTFLDAHIEVRPGRATYPTDAAAPSASTLPLLPRVATASSRGRSDPLGCRGTQVNVGWLEPLMARIKEDKRHVVMPIIDSIDADSFE